MRLVFCGDTPHADLRQRFAPWDDGRFIDCLGRTDIGEFVAVLGGAELIVSNDTGTVHIALALRRPTIVVSGGGLPGRYHPYSADAIDSQESPSLLPLAITRPMPCFDCGWHCRYAVAAGQAAPCVTAVSVEAVLSAALTMLAREPALGPGTPADTLAGRLPRPTAWRTQHS